VLKCAAGLGEPSKTSANAIRIPGGSRIFAVEAIDGNANERHFEITA
jgi:hypothetical protein